MAESSDPLPYYLELSDKPLRFETISKTTAVFVDEKNLQVTTVYTGEVTEFVVHSFLPSHCLKFQTNDDACVLYMKFSPDMKFLAIQQTEQIVKFLKFVDGKPANTFTQPCKKTHANILGLQWISDSEIVFVTDQSVEFYQVDPVKLNVKALQSLNISINWYVYCPVSMMMLVSSGPCGNTMQPLVFKAGNIIKLSKFEIEIPATKQKKLLFQQRDVALAMLYKQQRILVMSHNSRDSPNHSGASVLVYTISYKPNKTTEIKKTHVLSLGRSGSFALNVVDNLVVVHHQASMTSLIFDIMMTSDEICKPIGTGLSIKPFTKTDTGQQHKWELYSETWIMLQPNIIMDVKLGCLWYLNLCVDSFVQLIPDKSDLVRFLLRRSQSKDIILSVMHDLVLDGNFNLKVIAEIFDFINGAFCKHCEGTLNSQIGQPVQLLPSPTSSEASAQETCINSIDVYKSVLSSLVNHVQNLAPCPKLKRWKKYVVWVLLEYIRSLTDHAKPIQYFLFELIINFLVQNKEYSQLYLLLQYNVMADSKPLACLLLSLENIVPSAHQLALDMLHRKGAIDEITEVLLSKQQVVPALRYISSCTNTVQISGRKFLEAAEQCNDPKLHHSIQTWFQEKNAKKNESPVNKDLLVYEVTKEF
nr:PREDICTED: uncharacterized protein C18orf8 [Bemisia tabaci]